MKSINRTIQRVRSNLTNEKDDNIWCNPYKFFLCVCIASFFLLVRDVNKFRNKISNLNPTYKLPTITDLKPCIFLIPIIILIRVISKQFLIPFSIKIMKKSYRFAKTNKDKELFEKYKIKLPEHILKLTFYLTMTVFGYFILRDLDYFPKSLLGNGSMQNMFIKGYPNCFYLIKPKFLDIYYMIYLSYFFSNLILLLFINDNQTDFIDMLLYHACMIPLIIFIYFTNYSNVGCIVLFLHIETDIFFHLTKFLFQTDVYEIFKNISGALLIFNFLYMRIYVLGDIIYTLYFYMDWEWDTVTFYFFAFLIILYAIHINWIIWSFRKFYVLIKLIKLPDTISYEVKHENISKLK